jgi:hypothetical protein
LCRQPREIRERHHAHLSAGAAHDAWSNAPRAVETGPAMECDAARAAAQRLIVRRCPETHDRRLVDV